MNGCNTMQEVSYKTTQEDTGAPNCDMAQRCVADENQALSTLPDRDHRIFSPYYFRLNRPIIEEITLDSNYGI